MIRCESCGRSHDRESFEALEWVGVVPAERMLTVRACACGAHVSVPVEPLSAPRSLVAALAELSAGVVTAADLESARELDAIEAREMPTMPAPAVAA